MVKIFFSYSRKDYDWFEILRKTIIKLVGEKVSEIWSDEDIIPGESWEGSLERFISKSDIFILLLSPNYFSSMYIKDSEIPEILNQKALRDVLIIPVNIKDVDLINSPFNSYDYNLKPLSEMTNEERLTFYKAVGNEVNLFISSYILKNNDVAIPATPLSQAFYTASSTTGAVNSTNIFGEPNMFVSIEKTLNKGRGK
ncbi:MAG: toll/interleukin-1 receptor domain-containing protein [Ruminiclostridium sp.]|nr:toll/interleukin-1 receptor domain-containing protein [Ruminiclostridium sp.]